MKKRKSRYLPRRGPARRKRPRPNALPGEYRRACRLAERGDLPAARRLYERLVSSCRNERLRALARSDLAALAAMEGDLAAARSGFQEALQWDAQCGTARTNLAFLDEWKLGRDRGAAPVEPDAGDDRGSAVKVAILSLLFNWPSTGGGTVHTAETARFLARAGYDVRHFYARFQGWGVGLVTQETPYPAEPVSFEPSDWNASTIQRRFREAVDQFRPDFVIVTDSWSFKPMLAEAVHGYRYFCGWPPWSASARSITSVSWWPPTAGFAPARASSLPPPTSAKAACGRMISARAVCTRQNGHWQNSVGLTIAADSARRSQMPRLFSQ